MFMQWAAGILTAISIATFGNQRIMTSIQMAFVLRTLDLMLMRNVTELKGNKVQLFLDKSVNFFILLQKLSS